MKPSYYWLALLAVVLGGCARNVYNIELTPAGDSLERKLTVMQKSRQGTDSATAFDDEIQRIAKEYRAAPPDKDKSHVFRGRFAGRMPGDVGGHGTFTRWDTPFGSAAAYVERFRGNNDLAAVLKRRETTADRVIDLLVAWLEPELKGDPRWPALRRFLHEEFRRDLRNLTIYAWALRFTEKPEETYMRALQYLVERGYLAPDEIPAICRAITDANRDDSKRLLAWFGKLIAARVGGEAPRVPEHLTNPERLAESLTTFLETTDEYARLEQEWRLKLKNNPDVDNIQKPDGMSVASEFWAILFAEFIGFSFGGDQLGVALRTGRPAIFTNGHWTADSAKIKWPEQGLPDEGLPRIAYAVWDEPNEVHQRAHLGAVALHGRPLLEYCIWYHGLTEGEQKEWDSFVDTLQPDPELENELRSFRFRDEPAARAKDLRLTSSIVTAILDGLKKRP